MLRPLAVAASALLPACTVLFSPDETCVEADCEPAAVRYELGGAGALFQARDECGDRGGRLAMPRMPAQLTAAGELFSGDVKVWIDLSDEAVEGSWEWGDGEPLDPESARWWQGRAEHEQQPNGGEAQNCAAMDADLWWHDKDCLEEWVALCEIYR